MVCILLVPIVTLFVMLFLLTDKVNELEYELQSLKIDFKFHKLPHNHITLKEAQSIFDYRYACKNTEAYLQHCDKAIVHNSVRIDKLIEEKKKVKSRG